MRVSGFVVLRMYVVVCMCVWLFARSMLRVYVCVHDDAFACMRVCVYLCASLRVCLCIWLHMRLCV